MRLSIIGVEIDGRQSSSRTAEYLGWGGSLDDFATRPIWASYSRSPILRASGRQLACLGIPPFGVALKADFEEF